jgi:adenylylsulfate kinase
MEQIFLFVFLLDDCYEMKSMMKKPGMQNQAVTQKNIVQHPSTIDRAERELRNRHKGAVVWLTGLPGSGKSTIAHAVGANLHRTGFQTIVLDGDNVRHGLCADLGFSTEDRNENIRRVGEVAKLFMEIGTVVFVALVSPIRSARENVRQLLSDGDFIEIYCDCSADICGGRDPKGLYAKARNGLIPDFTGISSPYEAPLAPALRLDTANQNVKESVGQLTAFLEGRLRSAVAVPGK